MLRFGMRSAEGITDMGRPPLPVGTWGDVNAYEEEAGVWRASARYRGRDGRTRTYSRRRRTRGAAKDSLRGALGRMQAGDRTGDLTPESRVSDLLTYWETTWKAEKPRKVNTVRTYERALTLATQRVGGLLIAEATTGALEAAVNGVRGAHGVETGRQVKGVLSQAFADAVRLDLLGANPAAGISSRTRELEEVRALTVGEVTRLRAAALEWENAPRKVSNRPQGRRRIAASIDVMLGTGLRTGEMLALRRVEDLNLTALPATLDVSGTIVRDGGIVRQPTPKSKTSERTSYLPAFAVESIRQHMGDVGGGETGALFPSMTGTWWDVSNYGKMFREVRTIAGLEWATPKSLRKTVATTLGLDLGSAQLGHSGTAITARHYVEQLRIGPSEVVDLMDAMVVGDAEY